MEHSSLQLPGEDKQHKIKKHLTKKKSKQKITKNDKEKDGDLKDVSIPQEENTANRTDSPSRSSPEPNCAICLQVLTNKSFTDNCFHTFCFTCLLEWSKVKAECPLCKKQFKRIVHNVQNDMTFDEYHIQTRSTSNLWSAVYGNNEPRFRYPTTMTTTRYYPMTHDSYQSQIDSHRMRYAPHSVRTYNSGQITSRVSCGFRRRVYSDNLWVRPSAEKRTRNVSADFYRQNPACTHRLLPWLNRELFTLFQTNDSQITFVLELIIALVARYEITSQEFFVHIQPYIGTSTSHFIHEFYHFAISPYNMENYDIFADYGLDPDNETNREVTSSPDSDIIVDDSFNPNLNPTPAVKRKSKSSSNKRVNLLLKKNRGKGSWQCIMPPDWNASSNPGPSTSYNTTALEIARALGPSPVSELEDHDEEIQVVKVLKPRSERTPEIVDLLSDDDGRGSLQTVIHIPSEDESISPFFSPVPTPNFTFSPTREEDFSSDIECVFESEKPSERNENLSDNLSHEQLKNLPAKPNEKLSYKQEENVQVEEIPFITDNNFEGGNNGISSASTSADTNETNKKKEHHEKKFPTLSSAIVRPWATDFVLESSSSSNKRRVSSNYDSSTDSYSDFESSVDKSTSNYDRSPVKKRLKLRSVIAHFSFDSSSNNRHSSSYSSSHKKHKDKKKKKKKKHSHKHKRYVFSDSESSQKN